MLLPSGSLSLDGDIQDGTLSLALTISLSRNSSFKGPSLKTLCKLAVIQYNLDQSCLPHDIRYSEWLEGRD